MAAVITASLAGCGAAPSSSATPPSGAIPLQSASYGMDVIWATVAMGDLSSPVNTFWQLLALKGAGWAVATPPGVATNGPLAVSPGPADGATVGVHPSLDLRFSPLARTNMPGGSWTTGVLPSGLAASPDALATSKSRHYLALLAANGGQLDESTGDLSAWTPLGSGRVLARSIDPAGCRIAALTAAAFGSGSLPLVGARCDTAHRVPIFALVSGSWQLVGPALGGVPTTRTEVLRLVGAPHGAVALVSVGRGESRRLVVVSSHGIWSRWTQSASLELKGASLVSTSVSAIGPVIVEMRTNGGSLVAATVSSGSGAWHRLTRLPAGTAVVADVPHRGLEALGVDRSTLHVWGLGADGTWRARQVLVVPIQYGSSG